MGWMDEIVAEVNVIHGHADEDREWGLAALAAGMGEEDADTFVEVLAAWVAAGRTKRAAQQRRSLLDESAHHGRVLVASVVTRDSGLGLPAVRDMLTGALS